jgi:hypothetical protein
LNRLCSISAKIENYCPKHSCEILSLVKHTQEKHNNGKYIFVDEEILQEIDSLSRNYNYDDTFLILIDALDALIREKAYTNPSDSSSSEACP